MDYRVYLEDRPVWEGYEALRAVGKALGELRILPLIDNEQRTSGNFSVRAGLGFIITGAGVDKIDLRPDGLVAVSSVDESHRSICATGSTMPSSEVLIHHEIYMRFPWVNAIIHVHDDVALVACDRMGIPQTDACFTAATAIQARCVADLMERSDAAYVQIRDHGQFAVGSTLEEALGLVLEIHARARTEVTR